MAELLKTGCNPASLLYSQNSCFRSKQGFTLLEVMVALAILAITLTSIYRLHGQTMEMSARTRFYSQSPILAQTKLTELEREGIENSQDGSGDFGQDYPNYTWATHVEEVHSEFLKEGQQHLVRIEIVISQNEEDSYTLRTYRYYNE